jgi:hypothetical protein
VYEVRWQPLPNWAGHLTLMGLMSVLPPRAADRAMMTLTLVAFAGSIAWLRWRVAGWRGMPAVALLAAMLAMNLTWLFGFSSFLLGASLYAVTLGVWWGGRERFGPGRAAALAVLLVLGYFCHPISLGLTVGGLVVLALTTPGPRLGSRRGWTLLSFVPLVPLGWIYRGIMSAGGEFAPVWENLKNPRSLDSWREQLGWVDPLTLGSKSALPFVAAKSSLFGLLTPIVWVGLGVATLAAASVVGRKPAAAGAGGPSPLRERRGWALLMVSLVVAGTVSPDTFGPTHGFYMAQRIFLLGLVALAPMLEPVGSAWLRRLGTAALALAVIVQAGFVWDYALYANRVVGAFWKAEPHVGRRQRLGSLMLDLRGPYRVNPLLHIDTMLGVGTGNVVWSNYESAHYYFPVQVRPGLHNPPVGAFEDISIDDSPQDAARRASHWSELLEQYHPQIDVLVIRGRDGRLDAITEHWYETTYEDEDVRVMRRR